MRIGQIPVKWCTICDTQKLAAMFLSRPACPRCGRTYSAKWWLYPTEWCNVCDIRNLEAKFPEWTSGNEAIDSFIQNSQSNASHYEAYLEWIDPDKLSDIHHLADGGYGSVYTANLSSGVRFYKRNTEVGLIEKAKVKPVIVALKMLHSSKNITADFLTEVDSFLDMLFCELCILTKPFLHRSIHFMNVKEITMSALFKSLELQSTCIQMSMHS
jgi:hypothetical protein